VSFPRAGCAAVCEHDVARADSLPVEALVSVTVWSQGGAAQGRSGDSSAMATAFVVTLGRTMTQSALASTSAGTSLLVSIACNTVVALPRVSSSLPLSAAHSG